MEQYFPIHTEATKAIASKVLNNMPLPFEVTIQPYRTKRSQAQNRLYWKWLTEVSLQMEVPDKDGVLKKLTKEEWNPLCCMKFYGIKTIDLSGTEIPIPLKTSSQLKVNEFAELLTKMEAHFISKGVALTFTDDYGTAMGKQ